MNRCAEVMSNKNKLRGLGQPCQNPKPSPLFSVCCCRALQSKVIGVHSSGYTSLGRPGVKDDSGGGFLVDPDTLWLPSQENWDPVTQSREILQFNQLRH